MVVCGRNGCLRACIAKICARLGDRVFRNIPTKRLDSWLQQAEVLGVNFLSCAKISDVGATDITLPFNGQRFVQK